MEEQRLILDQKRAKIQDLSDEKIHNMDMPMEPGERSFLIQPEKKSLMARMPSIFSVSPKGEEGDIISIA
jgi:hypothetical protein